jgi:hypothetical protein
MIGRRMKSWYIWSLFFLVSCSHGIKKEDLRNYDLAFNYNPWLKIDLKTKVISVRLDSLQYIDTIYLTKEEQSKVMASFNDNYIWEIKGDTLFSELYRTMPASDFTINVLLKGKPWSSISIDSDYKNKGLLPFTKRHRMVSFKNDVLTILDNKAEVKKAKAVLLKYMQEHHLFLL